MDHNESNLVKTKTSSAEHGRLSVLGAPITVTSMAEACHQIAEWGAARSSKVVCICNAHSVVTASQDPGFMRILVESDMATPDGAPVAWMMRRTGAENQMRISGPELMLEYCEVAASTRQSIYLLGGSPETLHQLKQKLMQRWPSLHIAGATSPPFRLLTKEEDLNLVKAINDSAANVVFVGLGCPKQEEWMSAHRGLVQAVMVGVGAAFDFHAGTIPRAPAWMQRNGFEWLHRLISEPRRLFRRYLVTNSLFIAGAAKQLLWRR